MTTEELKQYYVNLLIAQYNNKPKARGEIGAFVSSAIADQIIMMVRDGFDLDTAIGKQLDTLGKYVGVERIVYAPDTTRDYFEMPVTSDPAPEDSHGYGMTEGATNNPPTNFFLHAGEERSQYILNDSEMRMLIKLKIAQHKSNCSLEDIDNIVDTFFNGQVAVTDNGDMTVTWAFAESTNFINIAVFTNSLPKPAGVRLIITGLS